MKNHTVINFLKCMDKDKSYMGHVMDAVMEAKIYSWDKETYFAIKVGIDLWRVNKEVFNQYCEIFVSEVAA